jgi:multiple sugar transport system permease protein
MQVDVQGNKSPVVPVTVTSARRRGSFRSPRRRALRLGLLFVSPWIAGFLLFFAYPFFATIYYSFTNFNGVGSAHWIGLANYVNLFHDPLFKTSIFNTFYYTAIELPLSTVAALGLALLLNMNVRGRAIYRTIFYIPSIVPLVASCMIFVWLFNPAFGIVNDLLIDAHLPSPDWFFSIAWSKPSFILLGLWGLGQPMVIYLAGLQGVPRELYEVAALDGAGPWQRLRHITIPMISPVILFNVILQLVLCISYFTQAQVIESADPGGPGTSTWFYVQYLYEQAFVFLKLGYSSAMAFFLFVISAVIMVLLFRSSSRWVYYASEHQ